MRRRGSAASTVYGVPLMGAPWCNTATLYDPTCKWKLQNLLLWYSLLSYICNVATSLTGYACHPWMNQGKGSWNSDFMLMPGKGKIIYSTISISIGLEHDIFS